MTKDNKAIKELSTDEGIERTARETYYMKKPNEDIYIIEYEDSIPKQKEDE
jgi:cell division protein FtsB